MNPELVVEIHDPYRKSGGTGYLIRDNLILTARHVVAPLEESEIIKTRYHIRFIGDYDQGRTDWIKDGCTMCWDGWKDSKLDLALLKLEKDKPVFLSNRESITCFGKLGNKSLSAEGMGFPTVQVIENRSNPEPLAGQLSRLAGLKENQLRLQVTSLIPKSSSGWKGISGAALFVDSFLVGVITETNKSFAEKVLWATPISIVENNEEFCALVDNLLPFRTLDNNDEIINPIINEDEYFPLLESWQNRPEEDKIRQWLLEEQVRLIGTFAAGGYGKSSLIAYLYQRIDGFQDKFWANFQEPVGFRTFGLWLGRKIKGDEAYVKTYKQFLKTLTDEKLVTELTNWLAKSRYLLVMDNLESLLEHSSWDSYKNFLQKWSVRGSGGAILITSQEKLDLDPNNRCRWLNLLGLPIESGINLLKSLGIQGSEPQLEKFVEIAEGHPLLLTLSASWIKQFKSDAKVEIHTLGDSDLTLFEEIVGEHRGNPSASVGKVLEKSIRGMSQQMQTLITNASVFRHPFSLKMAQAISSDNIKESKIRLHLIQRSLLIEQRSNGKTLFRFQPLIQRYTRFLLRKEGNLTKVHQLAVVYYENELKRFSRSLGKRINLTETQEEELLELLEIIYHRCEIGQAEYATGFFANNFDEVLNRLGYFEILQDYYQMLINKLEIKNLKNPQVLASCWGNLSAVYIHQGKYQKSIDAAMSAQEISREIGYLLGEALCLDRIGAAYDFQGKTDLAISYAEKALEVAKKIKSPDLDEAIFLSNLARYYDSSKQYEKAIQAFQKTLKIFQRAKDRRKEALILKCLGNAYYRLGLVIASPKNVKEKNHQEARYFYERALSIARNIGDRNTMASILLDLGTLFSKQKDFLKAVEYQEQALDIFRKTGDRRNELTCLIMLAVPYLSRGELSKAFPLLRQAKIIHNELGVPLDVRHPLFDLITTRIIFKFL